MIQVTEIVLLLAMILLGTGRQTDLALVPGGSMTPFYTVGTEQIEVAPFQLEVTPVSNAQFLRFVLENPRWRRSQVQRVFAEAKYLQHWDGDYSFAPDLSDRPVVNVSWFAARAYAQSLGRRLPTQDEWEMAAQATETALVGYQDETFRQRILAWYSRPTAATPAPVGSVYRNLYGIYDLHGLVWEWVEDYNTVLVSGDSRGDGELDRQMFCAAGVTGTVDPGDYAAYMRFGFRSSLKPAYTSGNLGFRCASDLISPTLVFHQDLGFDGEPLARKEEK